MGARTATKTKATAVKRPSAKTGYIIDGDAEPFPILADAIKAAAIKLRAQKGHGTVQVFKGSVRVGFLEARYNPTLNKRLLAWISTPGGRWHPWAEKVKWLRQ